MKKLTLLIMAVLCMTYAMAQNSNESAQGRPQPMTVEQMTENMVTKLGLSDEQATKLKALNTKYASVLQGPRMRGGRPQMMDRDSTAQQPPQPTEEQRQEMMTKMKEMRTQREAYNTELKAILTDAQYETYQKMMPQRGGHHGGPMKEQN